MGRFPWLFYRSHRAQIPESFHRDSRMFQLRLAACGLFATGKRHSHATRDFWPMSNARL